MQNRYSIAEALQALRTSKSALDKWIKKAGLREVINQQRMPDDLREHYLTRGQLEQLAADHRRQLATPDETDPWRRLEAVDSALSERIEALEQRVSALEASQQSTEHRKID